MGYVDQSRDNLDDGKTVWEEISGGLDILELGKREMNSRAYVGAFNFRGGDQQKKLAYYRAGNAIGCIWLKCLNLVQSLAAR